MLTSQINRHAKPYTKTVTTEILTSNVRFEDVIFDTAIARPKTNLSHFDILDQSGRVLDRVGNINGPEYRQQDGQLIVTKPGMYLLREYDSVQDHDESVVRMDVFEFSDGTRGVMGVRFWPEILSQPQDGAARLSLDGDGISVMIPLEGRYSFSYRLRNYLGQVSEPACVYVTAIA